VSRVDDVADGGPSRYCSPRHWMPFYSIEEGTNSRVNDVAGIMCNALAEIIIVTV